MKIRRFTTAALAFILAALPLTARPADQPSVLTITVASTSTTPSAISFLWNPILTTMPEFTQKAGIKIDSSAIQMGNAVVLAQTGNPPVIEGTGVASIAAGQQQGTTDVKFFMGELQKSPYELVVRKGITALNQIKTLGVPSIDSASSMSCQSILHGANLTLNKDYTLVLIGTSGARVSAVQAGKVDGSCELTPYPELFHDKYGMTILKPVGKQQPYFAAGGWGYNVKWANADPAHKEAVIRLAEAALLAMQWLYNPANKPKVLELVEKGLDVTPQYAEPFYERLVTQGAYTPDGFVPKASADGETHTLVDIGTLKTYPNLAQLFDWSIVQAAAARLKLHVRKPDY